MTPPIYLLKLRQINAFNLPIALLFQSADTLAFEPCTFSINDLGFINITIGNFVKPHCDNPTQEFRFIDWSQNLESLTQSLNQATAQNQNLIIGTYRSDQMKFLKNHYGDQVLTIGIDHTESSYNSLLQVLAKQHVYYLESGMLPITDVDQQILTNITINKIDYYANAFDQQQIIPKSDVGNYEYSILFEDFYNQKTMAHHLTQLNLPFNNKSLEFYNQWLGINR
jgi:hypothetical protein